MGLGRLLATVLALLAVNAAVARGEPFAIVADGAASPAFTDGTRFAVYMRDVRTAHVFDGRYGLDFDVSAPAACADPVKLEDVGGGQALVNCGDKGTWHEEGGPLLLDLSSHVWHEPAGAAVVLQRIAMGDDSGSFTQVGAHWLAGEELGDHSYAQLWLEWHTGEFRDDEGDARHAPDVDAPDLFVPLCRSLLRTTAKEYDASGEGPRFDPMTYTSPLGYFGLDVQRCGSARRTRLDTTGVTPQAAAGVVTWGHGSAVRAYQPYCAVRFSQQLGAAPSVVGHTDGRIYASQPRDGDRYRILRAPQPWCPELTAPRAVRVQSGGQGRVAELRAWTPAASDWAQARLPLVAHHVRALTLRPGAAMTVQATIGTQLVRWRRGGGRWNTAPRGSYRWRLRAQAGAQGTLWLVMRSSRGELGTFALPIR